MPIDALIANPGRLRILTALANEPRQEFVNLRRVTRMTDGNLATHARRLHVAGFVAIDKSFRDGKPVTTFTLTRQGRGALETHVAHLMQALRMAPSAREHDSFSVSQGGGEIVRARESATDSDWID